MENWIEYNIFNENIIAASTVKSVKYYNNFSFVYNIDDKKEFIEKNRHVLLSKLDGLKIVTMKQKHSDIIINIDKYHIHNDWHELDIEADGIITTKKGIAISILTADCLAIVASDKEKGIIGAVHAGWRGAKQEIVKKLILKMKEHGANIHNIKCAIAPGICGNCYEVDEKVINHFKKYPSALTKKINKKWLFDNKKVNIEQLQEVGVLYKNIETISFCTYCDNNKFFSYRKGDKKGRFLTFIAQK